ncbi:DUF1659 domain-containing protein [Clostridium weizhouense]|nr:DUF1659 domain-containing protein [Clostridium weizhouense]
MAVNKVLTNCSLTIEVQKGVDKQGDPVFKKKTFSNLNPDITDEAAYEIGNAFKNILDGETRSTFLNNTNKLMRA